MARVLVIEEIHLTLLVARGLPERQYRSIRRTLIGARFRTALRNAIQGVVHRYPSLHEVTVQLSR
jgi:hypothetical protein